MKKSLQVSLTPVLDADEWKLMRKLCDKMFGGDQQNFFQFLECAADEIREMNGLVSRREEVLMEAQEIDPTALTMTPERQAALAACAYIDALLLLPKKKAADCKKAVAKILKRRNEFNDNTPLRVVFEDDNMRYNFLKKDSTS